MSSKVEFGFISSVIRDAFALLKFLSLMNLLRVWITEFRDRGDLTQEQIYDMNFTRRRSLYIDLYMLGWILFEIIFFVVHNCGSPIGLNSIFVIFSILRIIEIVRVSVGIAIFDETKRPDLIVSHRERVIISIIVNYFELILLFGSVYETFRIYLSPGKLINLGAGYYFSSITQLTIGYGDIVPVSGLRIVAATQGFVGSIFVVILFARALTLYSPLINSSDDSIKPHSKSGKEDMLCWNAKEEND